MFLSLIHFISTLAQKVLQFKTKLALLFHKEKDFDDDFPGTSPNFTCYLANIIAMFIRFLNNIIAILTRNLGDIIEIFIRYPCNVIVISLIIHGAIIMNFLNYPTDISFLAPEYFIVLKIARK